MAESLGLAASIIAVLQITNSVVSVCYDYSAAVQGTSWELPRVRTEMESLRNVLQTLEPLAKQAEFASLVAGTRLPTLNLLCGPRGLLQNCFDEVKRLDERLKSPSWSDGFGPKRRAFIQALRWPLKEAETRKALENIGRFKDTLVLAITADQTTLALAIQDLSLSTNIIALDTQEDVRIVMNTALEMQEDIRSTKNKTQREAIHRWLSAPDPSTNHNRACRSRQATTGSWFLESEAYTHWKEQSSLLWLHGKAGCGKTILSSTIITEVLQKHHLKSGVAVAYFYFDFNDLEKQNSDKMIRSLITQLSAQSTKKLKELELLFSSCNKGERQPDIERLMTALKEIVEGFDETYIILDALDECSDRQELLDNVEEIQGWGLSQLHMLLTSRRLTDIEETLNLLTDSQNRICIQSALVDADILTYIHNRLQNDRLLKRWRYKPQVQEEIKTTLMKKADGMFRLAVCQLDALQDCLSLSTLRKALESLPKSLDETYARILCNIAEDHSQDAIKILQWLTYSARPLRIEELAEIVAVNVTGEPWFDCDARFQEQREILKVCSSLITIEEMVVNSFGKRLHGKVINLVRLAHFSVKEYLVSERIRDQAVTKYAIQEIPANVSIAATCLAYLLQFDQHYSLSSETIEEFPLARYAAEHWTQHARIVGKDLDSIQMLSLDFCVAHKEAYINWGRLYNPDKPWEMPNLTRKLTDIAPPLYYASLAGVAELVRLLLDKGVDVNAKGGQYGNALQAALANGNEAMARLLLDKGADVNSQGGEYGNALQAALAKGNEAIARLLLDKGVDVNAKGGFYGNALRQHRPMATRQ